MSHYIYHWWLIVWNRLSFFLSLLHSMHYLSRINGLFCLVFDDLFTEGGLDSGSSDTWYYCRREQEDDVVWQGPRLGFVAETGRFVAMDALSTIFLLLCLASYQVLFLVSRALSRYVPLRFPSSVQQSSATLQQVVRVLSCVVCILPHPVIPFVLFVYCFFVVLITWVACLLCSLLYPLR